MGTCYSRLKSTSLPGDKTALVDKLTMPINCPASREEAAEKDAASGGEHPGGQATLRLSELGVRDVLGKGRSACVRAALG